MTGLTSDLQVALPETLDPLRLTGGVWQNNSFRGGGTISTVYRFGPKWPRLGRAVYRATQPLYDLLYAQANVHGIDSRVGRGIVDDCTRRLQAGETLYFAGVGAAGHNAGVSLVEVSAAEGVRLIGNDEEERFTAIKHYADFPAHCVDVLKERLARLGRTPDDIAAFVTTWDYAALGPLSWQVFAEELPFSWPLALPAASPNFDFWGVVAGVRRAPRLLAERLGLSSPRPLLFMPHHENHAVLSYCLSPFANSGERVAIAVLDGFGDEGAMSLFVGEGHQVTKLRANSSLCDSLGAFYSIISSSQGGWTSFSSEGRYMGAVAWGNTDRLTNEYYRRLREIFHFAEDGQLQINRRMANWHLQGEAGPYQQALVDILGPPIPQERMWNPDAVLSVDDVQHSEITRDRVDKAAATQMVFEDGVFHIIDHLLKTTKCTKLVMAGGSSLNCLANMKLVERYNRDWYQRQLGIDGQLELWVPPTPSDAGVPMGACYNFALRCGASSGPNLQHAFHCGLPPGNDEILQAFDECEDVSFLELGDQDTPVDTDTLADFIAWIISHDGVVGLYQGSAETGPRALGHRSILANPRNPDTRTVLNSRVKFREKIRPLAPMATLEAAQQFFRLDAGASADNYNAYNYMVLNAMARPEALERIPAVIHHDRSARVQIVRPETDPLCHEILRALGRRNEVEVCVNTSLNVGSPIVQTPKQALETVRRAKAMTALILVAESGQARIAWHDIDEPPKDKGLHLRELYESWMETAGVAVVR
jgi:carbamoyltransferase